MGRTSTLDCKKTYGNKMKYLIFLVLLTGCVGNGKVTTVDISNGIKKFDDGPIRCYVYRNSISCVVRQ